MARPGNRFDFVLARRPAHVAASALAVGIALGPLGLHWLRPQLLEDGGPIETLTEVALLTCLFCLGLRLRMPFDWRTWRVPLRLATLTTLATLALAAAAAHLIFDLDLLESLLLGAIVSPTDSVAGSEGAAGLETELDGSVFLLGAESGINNGLAAVLVLVVLALMGLGDSESAAAGPTALLAGWSVVGGLLAGALIGTGMSRTIQLLDPERQAEFLEEAMVFATAALAYGAALALHTDGFLAVFAAGLALSHGGRLRRPLRNRALMPRLLRIAARVERYAWLVVLVLLGSLVGSVEYRWWMLVFAGVLMLLIRPLAIRLGMGGLSLPEAQWRSVAWFTGRGVASLYCLAFAINHGLSPAFAHLLAGVTLVVVVTSLLAGSLSGLSLSRPSADTVDL